MDNSPGTNLSDAAPLATYETTSANVGAFYTRLQEQVAHRQKEESLLDVNTRLLQERDKAQLDTKIVNVFVRLITELSKRGYTGMYSTLTSFDDSESARRLGFSCYERDHLPDFSWLGHPYVRAQIKKLGYTFFPDADEKGMIQAFYERASANGHRALIWCVRQDIPERTVDFRVFTELFKKDGWNAVDEYEWDILGRFTM